MPLFLKAIGAFLLSIFKSAAPVIIEKVAEEVAEEITEGKEKLKQKTDAEIDRAQGRLGKKK